MGGAAVRKCASQVLIARRCNQAPKAATDLSVGSTVADDAGYSGDGEKGEQGNGDGKGSEMLHGAILVKRLQLTGKMRSTVAVDAGAEKKQ